MSGHSPFYMETDADTLSKVTRGQWDFTQDGFKDISFKAKDFIKGLINKEPK